MRVLISGGGTGGHVYPALAVAAQIESVLQRDEAASGARDRTAVGAVCSGGVPAPTAPPPEQTASKCALLWVGSTDGVERTLVESAGIPYRSVHTGQIRGKNPLTALANAGKMARGVRQALAILDEFGADVCLVTGGYVCTPVVIACRLRGLPVMIYLPDVTPGLAVRWLSLLAHRVAVSFADVSAFFGNKAVVTGYPVRPELVAAVADRQRARHQLGDRLGIDWNLQDDRGRPLPLLLVFGGSQGARSINLAVWHALPDLLRDGQILHIVGERDWPMLSQHRPDLPESLARRYHPVSYLHEEMDWALAAADLVLARAGASTLGEFPVARLPAVLVPLPIAGGHQMSNARKLADAGGAEIMLDEALPQKLVPVVRDLLRDESKRLQMGANVAALARPRAAYNVAQALVDLVD